MNQVLKEGEEQSREFKRKRREDVAQAIGAIDSKSLHKAHTYDKFE